METPPVQTPAMVRWVLLGVALWASVAGPAELHCQSLRATVLSIGDGDTIRVRQASRTVAEVISDINLNLAMVEDGQAFAYRQYLGGCNAKAYLGAEERASRAHLGVWQVPGGITRPRDLRRIRRSAANPERLHLQAVLRRELLRRLSFS